jgi:hypothetical protein
MPDAWTGRLTRNPLATAIAFGLGIAVLATAAFSFPPGGPPLSAILAFTISLGLALGVVTYVGLSAFS